MEFIKDLLLIQQELIVKEMSTKLYKDPFDKQNFIIKYNKKNLIDMFMKETNEYWVLDSIEYKIYEKV